MAEYGLVKSFDIDNGELDGLSAQQCFVLGYELAIVDEQLKQPAAFSRPVHAENHDRIESACEKSGRRYSLGWMQDDVSEDWMHLTVAGLSVGE